MSGNAKTRKVEERRSEEVKKIISDIVQNNIKDPRIPDLISITDVSVTKDLRYAKVYISIFGNNEQKNDALKALKNAAGFIRKELGSKIQLRYTPELLFELDSSIEYGAYMNKLINDTIKSENGS